MHSGAGREQEGEGRDFTFISANAFQTLLCSAPNVPSAEMAKHQRPNCMMVVV